MAEESTYIDKDGIPRAERRSDEWYSNRDLHKMIIKISDQIRDLNHSIEKYNGLQHTRRDHEERLKKLEECVIQRTGVRLFFDAAIKYSGWIVALIAIYGFLRGA